MAPAHNLLRRRRHCDSYGRCLADTNLELFNQEKASLVPPTATSSIMAEQEEEGEDVGSSSTSSKQGGDDPFKGWLQLGIGNGSSSSNYHERTRSLELNLFPAERQQQQPLPILTSSVTNPNFYPMVTWGPRGPAEFRVVSPPARPQTGVWFELKAAHNQ